MTIYAVDIRDRIARQVPEHFIPMDNMRVYKVEAGSTESAMDAAIVQAKDKLASWERMLDEYYRPSLGLPQNTGTVPLMISRITKLRSLLESHETK